MGEICEKCNTHKVAFNDEEDNKKLCLSCGIKKQYKLRGIKGIYKTLRFYLKTKYIFSWKDNFISLFLYMVLIALTLISIFSTIYVVYTGQYLLILNSIISLLAIFHLWRD